MLIITIFYTFTDNNYVVSVILLVICIKTACYCKLILELIDKKIIYINSVIIFVIALKLCKQSALNYTVYQFNLEFCH